MIVAVFYQLLSVSREQVCSFFTFNIGTETQVSFFALFFCFVSSKILSCFIGFCYLEMMLISFCCSSGAQRHILGLSKVLKKLVFLFEILSDILLIFGKEFIVVFFALKFQGDGINYFLHRGHFAFEKGMNVFTLFWSSCPFQEV